LLLWNICATWPAVICYCCALLLLLAVVGEGKTKRAIFSEKYEYVERWFPPDRGDNGITQIPQQQPNKA
jgi:hypothetical protein